MTQPQEEKSFFEKFQDATRDQIADMLGLWRAVVPVDGHEFNVVCHVPGADGKPIVTKFLRIPSTQEQQRFYRMEPRLITQVEWRALGTSGRLQYALDLDLDPDVANGDDMTQVLPEPVQEYLTFWQRQMNSAECYFASHEMGARANLLLAKGFLLGPRIDRKGWTGDTVPSRDRLLRGEPGSASYVEALMGPEYLKWIAMISV